MKLFALIAVLLLATSNQAIADEANQPSDMLDQLEQFAEKVDALDRGEATIYELADYSNKKSGD